MAFLTKYRELRGETAEGLDEVEYNFGRVFQQLGMIRLVFSGKSSYTIVRAAFPCDPTLRTRLASCGSQVEGQ